MTREFIKPTLRIDRNEETGFISMEVFYENEVIHRIGGRAERHFKESVDVSVLDVWFKEGKIHREGGPAVIRRDSDNGVTYQEEWYRDGLTHRDNDLPAVISYDITTGKLGIYIRV